MHWYYWLSSICWFSFTTRPIGLHCVYVGSWKLVVLQLCLTPAIPAYKSYVTLVPGIEQTLPTTMWVCVNYADMSGY